MFLVGAGRTGRGRGSNLEAIAKAIRADALPIEIAAVISNRADAAGLNHDHLYAPRRDLRYSTGPAGTKAQVGSDRLFRRAVQERRDSKRQRAHEKRYEKGRQNETVLHPRDLEYKGYEDHAPAIAAGVDYLRTKVPGITRVVIFGRSMGAPMMAF